jgi:hypothetical protein
LPNPWKSLCSLSNMSTDGSCIASSPPESESKADSACEESCDPNLSHDNANEEKLPLWPVLLRRLPSLSSPSRAHAATEWRRVNAVWRGWWAAHQSDKGDLRYFQPELMFPSTPTSTSPGTPRSSSFDCEPDFCDGAPWTVQCSQPQLVFLPVPLQFATQVQDYIQSLITSHTPDETACRQGVSS